MKRNENSYPSNICAWTTVGILSITYMFSFIDRQILVLLVDPIKSDLQITDTQVSLLTGLAFAMVYSIAGIPMGRVADCWVRKYVIIIGVTTWSLLTIACGFTRNFFQLFFARMGVGLGEAALTPTAYAIMPDLFPPERLSRAMSIFVLGGILGSGLSMLFGGIVIGWFNELGAVNLPLIGDVRPWQLVLITVGIASLILVIPLSFVPEPKRLQASPSNKAHSLTGNNIAFKEVVHYLIDNKTFYVPFILSTTLSNLFAIGFLSWLPSFYIRIHQWDAASTGITLGSLVLLPSIVGSLAGGWLSDYFYGKGFRGAAVYLYTVALPLAIPLVTVMIYSQSIVISLIALVFYMLVVSIPSVLFPAIVQLATESRIRAQVSAIILLVTNLFGIGLGPTAIALFTDYVFGDEMALGQAIVVVCFLAIGSATICMVLAINPFKQRVNAVIGILEPQQNQEKVKKLLNAELPAT